MHLNCNAEFHLKIQTIMKWFPSLPMSDTKGLCRLPNLVEEINPASVLFYSHT
jgi:hypothetical protein